MNIHVQRSSEPGQMPFARGHWFYGVVRERRADPLGLFGWLGTLGEAVRFRVLFFEAVLVTTPELVKHVLVDNAANYWKGRGLQVLRPVVGNGLLTSEGDFWKRQRRLSQPAFHRERLAGLVEQFVEATRRTLDGWAPHAASGADFDVLPEMMALTMSIIARALFSSDVSGDTPEIGRALTFGLQETNRRLLTFNPLVPYLPGQNQGAYAKAIGTLDRLIYRLIDERRQMPLAQRPKDLLSMLLEAQDADTGEQMSDRQLRDETMTMFLAGHETTAAALSWLWMLLGEHPEAAARLQQELDEVLEGRVPTVADLPRLSFTLRCFEETLRLYPPAWITVRQAHGPDQLGASPIKAGTLLVISPWVLHHNPKLWDEPEKFDPDRFLPERSAHRPKHAYLPFSAGNRMCIGNHLALMEAQVIVAMTLQRYRMTLTPGQRIVANPQVTLRPGPGVRVTLQKNNGPNLSIGPA